MPLTFFVLYTLIALALINTSRASYRIFYHWNLRSNQQGEPVIIYGAGKAGGLAIREILTNVESGMTPIGFIDDDPQKMGRIFHGYPVLGNLSALESVIVDGKAKGVVVASQKIPIAKVRNAQEISEVNGGWWRCRYGRIGKDLCTREADGGNNECQYGRPKLPNHARCSRNLRQMSSRATRDLIRPAILLDGFIAPGGDLVPHVPQVFIEEMFHSLMKHLDRGAHRPHYSSANDSLCQFQVMEAEQVHPLIKIEQTFGDVMQAEELVMSAV